MKIKRKEEKKHSKLEKEIEKIVNEIFADGQTYSNEEEYMYTSYEVDKILTLIDKHTKEVIEVIFSELPGRLAPVSVKDVLDIIEEVYEKRK